MATRNQSLDVLRGIAIGLLLLEHFPFIKWIAPYGASGVTLFFVLSGFLISGLLFSEYERTGTIRIGRFLLRRGLKIWPSFYAYLLFVAFLFRYYPAPKPWRALGISSIFLSNYLSARSTGVVGHTWSLAVEEHFYLLLPILLLTLIAKRRLHWIPVLCVSLMIACACLRFLFPEGAHFRTDARLDSLFVGVTLGYLSRFRPDWLRTIGKTRNLIIAVPCVITWNVSPQLSLAFVHVGYAIILAWFVERSFSGVVKIAIRPLAQLGIYSYCIYLWQEPFAAAVYDPRMRSTATLVALVVAAIVVGIVMSHAVEQPVLALRERLLPKIAANEFGERDPVREVTGASKEHQLGEVYGPAVT